MKDIQANSDDRVKTIQYFMILIDRDTRYLIRLVDPKESIKSVIDECKRKNFDLRISSLPEDE